MPMHILEREERLRYQCACDRCGFQGEPSSSVEVATQGFHERDVGIFHCDICAFIGEPLGQEERTARVIQVLLARDPTLDLRPGSVARGVIDLMLQAAGDGDYSFLTNFDNMQRAAQLSHSNYGALLQEVGRLARPMMEVFMRPIQVTTQIVGTEGPLPDLAEAIRALFPVESMSLPAGILGVPRQQVDTEPMISEEMFAEELVAAHRLSEADANVLRERLHMGTDPTEVFTRREMIGFTKMNDMAKVAATPSPLPDWCRVGQLVRRRTDGSVVRILSVERTQVTFAMAAPNDVLTHYRFRDPPFEEEYTLVQPRTRWELLDEED